ncbi:hypothetical protein IJH26_01275 [Candidatus Saccharibacteria bacterium]|nr:hypothetical protein [Candidatus Saccharibacteria bacterium]
MKNAVVALLASLMIWLTAASYLLANGGFISMRVPATILVLAAASVAVLIICIQNQDRPRPR